MLNTLEIGYIKSFEAAQTVRFVGPSGVRGSGYNVLVGKNNSGKSTAIKFLREMFSEQEAITIGQEARYDAHRPHLSIDWANKGVAAKSTIATDGTGGYFRKQGGDFRLGARMLKFIPSRRAFTSQFQSTNPIDPHSYDMSDYVNRRNNIAHFDTTLSGSLARILSDPNLGPKIIEFLHRIDSRIAHLDADNVGDRDVIRFRSASGRWHIISDTGDGVINLIRIGHALATSVDGDCVVIDEPELSLHPQLQRRLYEVLAEASSARQIIIITHSPHFVSWSDIASVGLLCRFFLDKDGRSQIRQVSRDVLTEVRRTAHNNITSRKYYDAVAKEMLFSDEAVLVEGPDDVHYISNYLESTSSKALPLMGYGCGGAGNIVTWMRLCRELGIRTVAIYDANKRADFDRSIAEFNDQNLGLTSFILNRNDIRDKHKRDERGSETDQILDNGVFRRNGEIHDTAKVTFDCLIASVRTYLQTD